MNTIAELAEEARRNREHAANIEQHDPAGARQSLARAERIERALVRIDQED